MVSQTRDDEEKLSTATTVCNNAMQQISESRKPSQTEPVSLLPFFGAPSVSSLLLLVLFWGKSRREVVKVAEICGIIF
jgi:hypothetical protein